MMMRIVIASELCTQRHRNVGIVEDGLRMNEIDQVVALEVSGIVEWHCARLGRMAIQQTDSLVSPHPCRDM